MTSLRETLHVLLVEDEPGMQVIVENELSGSDIEVVAVPRLAEALDRVADHRPDLVLLDLGLPDSQGLDGVRRLLEAYPDLPVVVLTGHDDDDIATAAVRHGAQDYVIKGSSDRLDRLVRNTVERCRLQDQLGRLLRRESALVRLGQLALGGSSLQDLAGTITEIVAGALGSDAAALIVGHDGGMRVLGAHGWPGASFPLDVSHDVLPILSEVSGGDRTRACADIPGELGPDNVLTQMGYVSAVASPVVGHSGGVLSVFDRHEREYSASEVQFLEAMARAIGEADRRRHAEAALRERVKEQTAVALVSRLVQRYPSRPELLEGTAAALAPAMQFPELTGVAVELDRERATAGPEELAVELRVPVTVGGALRGHVRVGYTEERAFLDEERDLLHRIAETLAAWATRDDAERARDASDEQLRALIEQHPGYVWTVDRELVVTSVVGQPLDEGAQDPAADVGSSIVDLAHPHGVAEEAEAAHRRALTGERVGYRWSAEGRTWQAQLRPLRDGEGQVIGAIGGAMDVTEQVEASRQVEESRRRLQGLFDHALEAIFLFDDEPSYVDANPAALRLVGLTRDEVVGRNVEGIAELLDGASEGMRARGRSEGRVQLEQTVRRKDGAELLLETSVVPDIAPGLHLLTARDVTAERRAEDAVRRSEERFRALVERASDVVAILDMDQSVRFISPSIERIIGYPPRELVGRSVTELLAEPDRAALTTHWTEVAATTEPIGPLVHRLRHRDGTWRHVEVVHTNRTDDPAVGGVIVNLRDVSERVQTQSALRQSEERFRRLAENAPDLIYRVSLRPRPHLEYLSPAIEHLTGYPADRFYTDMDAARALLEDLEHGAADLAEGETSQADVAIRHRDGSVRWVEQRSVVLRDRTGDPLAIEAIARDVTAARQAEEALRSSEERLARVLETMNEGMLMFNRSGHLAFANDAAERVFEAASGELHGRHLEDPAWGVTDPEGRPLAPEGRVVERVLASREPLDGVLWSRVQSDGARIVWETNASPLRDSAGELTGVIISLRDVTDRLRADRILRDALDREREAAEHLRQADQMKTGFLQAVSHELRTPLTSVLGFSLLLQRHAQLPVEQVDRLTERLAVNAQKLDRLLADLLDVDRLSRGTIEARRTAIDVDELLRRTVNQVDGPIERVTVLESGLTAEIDGPRTERIIENLVLNALRHTGGKVEVEAEADDEGLLLTVADRGTGVPDELKTRVFEPFQQGDTPASKVGGAGIGLTVVRTFAELHSGRAWVEDRPGGGAAFRVMLPTPPVPAPAV